MTRGRFVGMSAALTLATAAFAQPSSTDLGTLVAGTPINLTAQPIATNTIVWYKFTLSAPASFATTRYLNIDTVNSAAVDTEIGVYSSTGAMIVNDDDDADGNHSALSFGTGNGVAAGTGGTVSNGRDGDLAAGTYYLAVGLFNTTFNATAWSVTSAATTAATTYNLNLDFNNFSAPPAPSATDLGTFAATDNRTGTLTGLVAGETRWIKFTVPTGATLAGTGYLDIDTNGGTYTGTDTQIALYRASGQLLDTNDESGPSSYSSLSYGRTTPNRPGLAAAGNATAAGAAHAGVNGAADITAGTYYLAIGGFSTTYGNFWAATTTHTRSGDVAYVIDYVGDPTTTNPNGTGTATPNSGPAGANSVFAVTVTPGTGPTSTGIGVTVNAAGIGAGTVTLLDNGVAPDATAGDNIFSANVTVGAVGGGAYSLPITVTDAQARTGTGNNIAFTVVAPPAVSTDLGTFAAGSTGQSCVTLAAGEVEWFKVVIPAVASPDYFDLWTSLPATGALSNSDTEIGVYTNAGTLEDDDDDSDDGLLSALSYGAASPARPAHGTGLTFTGQDGATLAAGTYWVSLSAFNTTFANGWQSVSTSTATGDACLNWNFSAPIPPSGTGTATPDPVGAGDPVTFAVTVTPGQLPASTGLGVTVNLTTIGGSASFALLDNGVAPDATAGDNIFTATYTVPGATSGGVYNIPFTVTDAQARSFNGTIANLDVTGSTPPTGVGSVVGGGNLANCGASTLQVTVTPGSAPVSTGITVDVDTTAIGGGPGTFLLDDGNPPDATAGDNIFSGSVFPFSVGEGAVTLPFTVSDAQARSSTGNLATRTDSAGDLPATARQQGDGTDTVVGYVGGVDVDMFAVCVFDPVAFGVNMLPETTFDTQVFVFAGNVDLSGTPAFGTGVVMNDDDPAGTGGLVSNLSGFTLPTGGHYYVAISTYNRDPQDAGSALLWNNTGPGGGFDEVWPANGPGGANPVASWVNIGGVGGQYTAHLAGSTTVCPGDLDSDGDFSNGGTPDCGVDINDLLFFLSGFEAGDIAVDLDNGNGAGVRDCATDINDLLYFLTRFEAGC